MKRDRINTYKKIKKKQHRDGMPKSMQSRDDACVDSVYVLTHINSIYIYWSDEVIVKYNTARDCIGELSEFS